jgi:ferritin
MINKKLETGLNEQINAEFYSAYLYLSMSAYLDTINYAGLANWMLVQFQEEQFHAKKMFDYLIERGGKVTLTEIAAPPVHWDGPIAVFQATLDHERMVTKRINDLVYLARDERDNAVEVFLQWFVSEQVEEEGTAETLLAQLKIAESSPHALLMLDRELATRVFTPPAK